MIHSPELGLGVGDEVGIAIKGSIETVRLDCISDNSVVSTLNLLIF